MTLPVSDHVYAVTWGYAGAIGGMYVICIWGVTQMGDLPSNNPPRYCERGLKQPFFSFSIILWANPLLLLYSDKFRGTPCPTLTLDSV